MIKVDKNWVKNQKSNLENHIIIEVKIYEKENIPKELDIKLLYFRSESNRFLCRRLIQWLHPSNRILLMLWLSSAIEIIALRSRLVAEIIPWFSCIPKQNWWIFNHFQLRQHCLSEFHFASTNKISRDWMIYC